MKSGTIFDNVLITDDVEYAETFGADTWGKTKDAEKEMKKKVCVMAVVLVGVHLTVSHLA